MLYIHTRCIHFFRLMIAQPQLLLVALAGIVATPFIMPLIMCFDIRQVHLYVGSILENSILSIFFNDGLYVLSLALPLPGFVVRYIGEWAYIPMSLGFLAIAGIICYLYQVMIVDMCQDALNNIPSNIIRSAHHAFSKIRHIVVFVITFILVSTVAAYLINFLGNAIFGADEFVDIAPPIASFIMLVLYVKLLFSSYVLSNESNSAYGIFCRSSILFGAYAGYLAPIVYTPLYVYFILRLTQVYLSTLGTTRVFFEETVCSSTIRR